MKPTVIAPVFEVINKTDSIVRKYGLNTVCFSSKCPNIGECFGRGAATFMIMGSICTKNCRFCNITSAKPQKLDKNEPLNIANAVKKLKLKYVVITSPDRDDLSDFGSGHFVNTIKSIKSLNPYIKIEALTPSFEADLKALESLVMSDVYKLAHNIETVNRLHKYIKPKSDYKKSLQVLEYYSRYKITKSSIIVGFGESKKEIRESLQDLRNVGVSQVTLGQYLQPDIKHLSVKKFYTDEEFLELKEIALDIGFNGVESGKLVRSSYYADRL